MLLYKLTSFKTISDVWLRGIENIFFVYVSCSPKLCTINLWVKALTIVFSLYIPKMVDEKTNTIISILHPQIKVVGWAMKQMLLLAEFLSKENRVEFYTFLWNDEIASQNSSFSTKSSFSHYPLKFLSFFIIAWQIRLSDTIICGNSPMHFIAVFSKIFFWSEARIIWWHHHYPWYYEKNTGTKTYFKKMIEKTIVTKIDTIVWNSRFLWNALENIYSRDIEIIYPMIDNIYFDWDVSSKIPQGQKILFAWGRWEKWKWLWDIMEIYESCKDSFDIQLYIAWSWTEIERYKKLYRKDKKVSFLWNLTSSEMKETYRKSDLFLFSSQIDSFWLVILESLMSNTPVITYKKGEAPFLIDNWINWYCENNIVDYIERVKNILLDDMHLMKLSQNTKKSPVSNYSMKHFIKQWKKIIFQK